MFVKDKCLISVSILIVTNPFNHHLGKITFKK